MDSADEDWWIVHTGEYVLGLLDEQDIRVLDRVMQHEPDVQSMVGQWNDWFQPLSNALTPIEPPDNLLPEIIKRLPQQTRRASTANGLNGTANPALSGNNASSVGGDTAAQQHSSGIDESASVMQLLRSNQRKTNGWRTFAGVTVAACLLLCLVYGAHVQT